MPKGKGENTKKAAGNAKKAEVAQARASKEKQKVEATEAEDWAKGAKDSSSKEAKEQKAREAAARKAEAARLLAEEEASLPSKVKAAPKAGAKKAVAQQPPRASIPDPIDTADDTPAVYSASGIDDALDLLSIVSDKNDKASLGQKAATGVDTHPERRFKAAFETYRERELPRLRQEFKGLRLQQLNDMMYKDFQKHPDNPFNQVTLSFDATKADKVEAIKAKRSEIDARLREQAR